MNSNHLFLDNIIYSGQKSGGISVVWYELIKRLVEESDFSLDFIDNSAIDNPYRRALNLDGHKMTRDRLYPLSSLLPVYIKHKSPFIFHSSYYRYCCNPNAFNITTVHDFTYEYYRKGVPKKIHCWQKYQSIRHSKYIVCISENTKKDLLRFLPDIEEDRIRVIYNGVSEDYYPLECDQSENLPFGKGSYVVFVGARGGYKNFDFLKCCIAKSKCNLVIVGSALSEEEKQSLEQYVPQNRYCCLGFLPNKELNVIYNYAAALVYPSAYEGFGIPVIEAQRAGCPVIAYNSSSIPEVIGDTPLLMSELSEKELLQKLELLSDSELTKKVRADGLENAKRFSWDKMYQGYLDLYKNALKQISK